MKTLYVNINHKPISSSGELVILDYDLMGDLFFYLGERIAKRCKVPNENALITDFNTPDNKQDYDLILSQWNEVKRLLFSEEVTGSFNFELPSGYLHWLRYNEDYNHVYEANFSNGGSRSITIDLEELYDDSIEALKRKIMRKLQKDDLYLEIDEIVFNDEDISRKSKIVCAIKEKYESIGFRAYKKWLEECVCRCVCFESSANELINRKKMDKFFPIHNVILHETSSNDVDQTFLEEDGDTVFYKPNKGVCFTQKPSLSFFSTVYISEEQAYPKSWENILGLKWGMPFTICKSTIEKHYRILWEKENDNIGGAWTHQIVFVSADNVYLFVLEFLNYHLDWITVYPNQCPFCLSNNLKIFNRYGFNVTIVCKDCGKRTGDEESPICPNCGSDDIDDDGSEYLQYTCNDCGHNWGHDDTLECPECGSNDIENNGANNAQYECNVCGHMWGGETI